MKMNDLVRIGFSMGAPNLPAWSRPASAFTRTLGASQGAAVGWTAPAATYDKMRQMHNGSAEPFERDVQRVADPAYRAAWDNWYHHAWLPFYQKYAGPDSSSLAKLGAALYSDELASRAESFRQQLAHFYATFSNKLDGDGRAVGMATGAAPTLAGESRAQGLGLPWWVWLVGAGAAASLGWYGYQQLARTRSAPAARTQPERRRLPLRSASTRLTSTRRAPR